MWTFWLLLAAAGAGLVTADDLHGCPSEADILPCRCTMRADQLQIWCSHSDLSRVLVGLQAVGTHVTRPVDELILENNHLPSLPGNVFSALRVVRLMLRDNGLERVAASWLAGLEDTLLEVFVVEPRLRSLPADSMEQLRGLEAVTLQGGAMKRLPRFSGLPRLRYLHIHSPALIELSPHGFKALGDLEQLHVTFSPHLTRLEGGFLQDLPRLRLINVSNCGLTWIHPRALARLPALKELSLVGNRLADAGMVGRAARDLPALSILRLDGNHFDRLGEASFVDLPVLREISLSGNRISEIQRGAFDRLPTLRKLDLSRNRVRRIHPEAFMQQLGNLEELWLAANSIDHVAEVRALLDSLPRLRYLDLSYNYIEEVPFGALRGHPTLERLHLEHNRVQHIQREAFTAMPALRELRLRNNSLSNFLDGPLWNLPGLKGLDLSYNYFRHLDPRLLTNLPSLRRLDLSGNSLEMIDPAAFINTPALEHVNLSRNALSSLHPATFRDLLGLFELDIGWNRLRELTPMLPRALEYLHVPRNQLTSLPHAPGMVLPALRLLDLTGNGIQRIHPGSMSGLVQLRWLHMGENALQSLEEGSLNGLARLESLDLHDNRLLNLDDRCLRDVRQLKHLNLHGNRLERLGAQHLQENMHLTQLDLSHNQLNTIEHNALASNRELQELDASNNALTDLPDALQSLTSLQLLDLTNNRLKALIPTTLGNMKALSELRLARNKLKQLQEDAFHGLPQLELLDLDSNELETMESNAVRSLPELKAVRLGRNRLVNLPSAAFSDLPQLQSAELQENRLANIANNAFTAVPQLLLLNLSYNQLTGLNNAGLKGLKSLEVLDVSHNQVSRVGSGSLDGMEWLVELKMDNNHICTIQGSPFNGMPRLRVLSLKNNRMTTLAEPAFQRLRNNIAVLDIDGNPLSCSCGMIWLQAWLKEASSEEGPRCADGSLLKEARLSRQDCRNVETPANGCEASAPGSSTSQLLSTWMEVKDSTVSPQAPSPEESEYFYDEYVEYQYEDGNSSTAKNHSTLMLTTDIPLIVEPSSADPSPASNGVSSHYIPGDTPTFYAGSRHEKNKTTGINNAIKQPPATPTPSSSGFTFFGIPLPSLSLGGLWGSGRNADAKAGNSGMRFVGARGKVQMLPSPTVQTGGFVPMLPGSGGFVPIAGPHVKENSFNKSHGTHIDAEHQLRINYTTWSRPGKNNSTISHVRKTRPDAPRLHPSKIPFPTLNPHVTLTTTRPPVDQVSLLQSTIDPSANETADVINHSWQDKQNLFAAPSSLPNDSNSKDVEENFLNHTMALSTQFSLVTNDMEIEMATKLPEENNIFSSDVNQHKTEKNESQEQNDGAGWGFVNWFDPPTPATEISITQVSQPTTENSTPTLLGNLWGMISGQQNQDSPSSLSALLVPGGQQPQFRPAGGRPTITKVSSSTPTPVSSEVPTEEYLRGPEPSSTKSRSLLSPGTSSNSSVDWYYQNYNKTNLEPYVGPGKTTMNSVQVRAEATVLSLITLITATQFV
ncbi:protein artichoke [Periplaneta americana]|uniref:protein artichoke n=1 Tax=Periplaneta americana TaxID=6978 RepID=UPI0037E8E445